MSIRKYCKRENPQVSLAQSNQTLRPVEMEWCHICAGTFLRHSGEQQSGALGLRVACAAGFEEVREHPYLHMTSTGPEEAPDKSSSSPVVMRAVEKRSPPEQCYSPEPRNQAHLLPYPVFHGCLLRGLYL